MGRVSGKMAFITGGASGLGLASAELMVREGAKVVLADLNIDGARAAAARLGPAASAVRLDVTDEANWGTALDEAVKFLGGLNVLVHSAGIGVTKNIEETTLDEWRKVHAVNLDGPFYGTRRALPLMRPHAPGSIVIISSVSGIIAGHNMCAYNTSKAGARMLAKSIALHCAKRRYNIRCNSVHPTFIDTPMVQAMLVRNGDPDVVRQKLEAQVPLGRIGEPADVANGILYLASDESKFTTGAELVIDGGITAM